jgi:hypothetical protein
MSNFPLNYDDDTTLPFVNDNLVEIGGEAINAVRDAVFQIEREIGLGASGTAGSISQRLGVALLPDGSINPSAIASLGLVTLPITNDQIIDHANIPESKLKLDYKTIDLFNYIRDSANDINTALGWITISGIKLEPHIAGAIYRHDLVGIDVNADPAKYLKNRLGTYRDNTNAYTAIDDLNTELLEHQFADGYPVTSDIITTNDGSTFSANYAHPAMGIFLNSTRFAVIPQTTQDLQEFAQFIDDSSIFLLGTRIQNLYTNGISRSSRSTKLGSQVTGQSIIPITNVVTYLLNTGGSSSPVDDIDVGDDIVEFKPSGDVTSTYIFDTQFAQVKPGDIIRVNYGTYGGRSPIEVAFVIKEKKFISGSPSKYIVRIAGKNLYYTPDGYATAQIDKPLFNNNKYGVLAVAASNHSMSTSIMPSLIVGSPRGAMALGLGFNPDLLDSTHYLLYLVLYPTGHPASGQVAMPPIDVTGNSGATPGLYTLDSVIAAINNQFRQPGYNYRFIAFQYQGEIGIMLADCYNNAAFSIINAVVDESGNYDETATNVSYPNNVVGVFATAPLVAPDPLGFGDHGAAIASPPYKTSYGSTEAAQIPTKIFVPVTRANYYVNGTEKDKLTLETDQTLDGYGDGYWLATITNRNPIPGIGGRVETTYRINNLDLSATSLKEGKTLVIQSAGDGSINDYGRFIIKSIAFGCGPSTYTDITVYDAVHATAISPAVSSSSGNFALYFNSDSVTFNAESATDFSTASPFRRHFEVFINENAETFTHERGRINISGGNITVNGVTIRSTTELSKLNIIRISPKLRGYQFGAVTKISLRIVDFSATGDFSGYLCSYDGSSDTKYGPTVSGKHGEVTRFYDETHIDYIDVLFDVNTSVSPFSDEVIDFQLFPSLSLDEEIMMIATCQHDTITNEINYVRDERQFGNISEKDLSTSALSYISLPDKMLHENGVFKGFDLQKWEPNQTIVTGNPYDNQIYLRGGSALVGGKVIYKNSETVAIPKIEEYSNVGLYPINWLLCVNDQSEYQTIPLLDYDEFNGTPNTGRRLFVAYNPANAQTYYLDAVMFSDVINSRKDLTPLYIVFSTVSEGVSTLEVKDVRKYVLDVESNLPMKYNSANTQGNFKDVGAIFRWLKFNSSFNGQVVIKGTSTAPYGTEITDDLWIGTTDNGSIVIDGDNEANLHFSGVFRLGSNVTFKNINLRFSNLFTIATNSNNIRFENCTITFVPNERPNDNVLFDLYGNMNVVFKDCLIYGVFLSSENGGSVFRLTDTDDFLLDNCSVNATFSISPGTYYPGSIFWATSTSNTKIRDSYFTGNFKECMKISDTTDNLTFTRNTVTSTYDPQSDVGIYDSTNLVNSGHGFIQANIGASATLENIVIEDSVFTYAPAVASSHRFSFINFQLTYYNSVLKNLRISGCKFNNSNQSTSTADNRAAISIINTAAAHDATDPQPLVYNALITNNMCDKNQSIIITSKLSGTNTMVSPALIAVGCTISNNICGTIGYWVGSGSVFLSYPPTTNPYGYNDKYTNLTISNNSCYYIGTQDHTGKYFLVSKRVSGISTNMCAYASGNVTIQGNKASWIHVGIAYEDDSKLSILDNHLSAYNPLYHVAYNDIYVPATINPSNAVDDGESFGAGCAIFVNSNVRAAAPTGTPTNGNNSSCIISGNIIGAGYIVPTQFVMTYLYGGIYCKASSTITNNIVKGIASDATYERNIIIAVAGTNNIVTNNKLYRGTASIYKYVAFKSLSYPSWDGNNSSGLIVDNYFDGYYISDVYLNDSTISYPNPDSVSNIRWTAERNINQTVRRKLRVLDGATVIDGYVNQVTTGIASSVVASPTDDTILKVTYFFESGKTFKTYKLVFELTDLLPPEVLLTSVSMTVTGQPYTNDGSGIATGVNIINQINMGAYKRVTYPGPLGLHLLPSAGETYVMTVNSTTMPAFVNYVNSLYGRLCLEFVLWYQCPGLTQNLEARIEDIEVKYRW